MTHGDTTGTSGAVVGEDVLDGHVPPAPDRGPRTRFNRKRDYALLLGIVAALAVTGLAVFQNSEIEATASKPSAAKYGVLAPPEFFPPSLGEAWRAQSAATWQPVVVAPQPGEDNGQASTVITGDGGEVAGRDPETGDVRWSYTRDLPLCAVSAAWKKAVAFYRTDGGFLPGVDQRAAGGCSEVTTLNSASGERDAQRNSDAELGTRLIDDGDHLTTTGANLLTTVRSDLVKTMEYGNLPAKVNPGKQPRADCAYESVVATPGKIGVIERCTSDPADRLTVYRATAKDSDTPEVVTSVVTGSESAQVVAMNGTLTAVALPDPSRIVVYDEQGTQVASYPIEVGATDLRVDPPGRTPLTSPATGAVYWYTGSRTIVLSSTELRPLWTVEKTLGPGTVFAGRALVPVPEGIAVLSQADGARVGTIPVERDGFTGPVTMSTVGPVVLEQRGTTVVALH